MAFPCTRCGCCCLSVDGVLPLMALGWVGFDGACIKYDRQRRECSVYAERPMVCRIDEGRPAEFSPEEWEGKNLAACDYLHLKMYSVPRESSGVCAHVPKES